MQNLSNHFLYRLRGLYRQLVREALFAKNIESDDKFNEKQK